MILFCSACGSPTASNIPDGDNRHRRVCTACGFIHYENPRLVVGCIVETDGKILMCRRAIEPRYGYWTLPAGFMENGETTADAAARETLEEAGAVVCIDAPFAMISIAHIHQVHLFYRGHLTEPEFSAGEESLEVALLAPSEIPWSDLAFRSVRICLEHYLSDRASGTFGFHEEALEPLGETL